MRRRIHLIAPVVAFVVGAAPGFLVGRTMLEATWNDGIQPLSGADVARSSIAGADPTPKAGTRVLRDMPVGRARVALGELTADDPVKVTVGAFGRDGERTLLHLELRNDAPCEVIAVEGVAYGFDSLGRPAAVNKAGEGYVSFSDTALALPPGGEVRLEQEVHFAPLAAVALAQVDSYVCRDGRVWQPLR